MKNSLLLLALAAGFTFTSCSKDDDTAPQTKTEILTAHNWKITAQTTTVNSNPPSDTYALKKDCNKDDFTTFATDGKLTVDEGPSKCAINEPQTQIGTWEFTENESKLKMTQNNTPVEYSITELTPTKIELTYSQSFTQSGQTNNYTYVTTYSAQ